MKRNGTRILSPASPRQQWVVEMWNNNHYEGFKLFPDYEQAVAFAYNFDEMLNEYQKQADQ